MLPGSGRGVRGIWDSDDNSFDPLAWHGGSTVQKEKKGASLPSTGFGRVFMSDLAPCVMWHARPSSEWGVQIAKSDLCKFCWFFFDSESEVKQDNPSLKMITQEAKHPYLQMMLITNNIRTHLCMEAFWTNLCQWATEQQDFALLMVSHTDTHTLTHIHTAPHSPALRGHMLLHTLFAYNSSI